ncbi:unnamed protein product, partial [Onchocerca ochengi]
RGAIPTYSVRKSTVTSPHKSLIEYGAIERTVSTVATQTTAEDKVEFDVETSDNSEITDCKVPS